jgi:hypothetical protein
MEVHVGNIVATAHSSSERKIEEITKAVIAALEAAKARNDQLKKDRSVTSGPRDVQEGEA